MKSRLEWSNVEMLRSFLYSWIRVENEDSEYDDLSEIYAAVEYITSNFREAFNINIASIQDEIEEAIDYARKYLSIQSESYQKIWYKLHISPEAVKWPNVLVLAELLFSLPFSNGRVERIFSSMKIIKTDRRTNLHIISTLSDLLEIQ